MDSEPPSKKVNSTMESDKYETLVRAEYLKKQPIPVLSPLPLSSRSIYVPPTGKYAEHHIIMTDADDPHKALIYKLIVAAYNFSFFHNDAALTAKESFYYASISFVDWLNEYKVENPYKILKDYEGYYFDKHGNHGSESQLVWIKRLFYYALDCNNELATALSIQQLDYLSQLRNTRSSPTLNRNHKSIATYFGALDWLRRDDVGVGGDLYVTLASAKLTTNSLLITSSSILLELEACKLALKAFLKEQGFGASFFTFTDDGTGRSKRYQILQFIGCTLYRLISSFHSHKLKDERLINALDMVVSSAVRNNESYLAIRKALKSQDKCNDIFGVTTIGYQRVGAGFCQKFFCNDTGGELFCFDFLASLVAETPGLPVIDIEQVMFAWLMSGLTVQPTDIAKLDHDSFRKIEIGRKVIDIECEYFKGRAKVFHTTRSLSTKTLEGEAVLAYLKQHQGRPLKVDTAHLTPKQITSGYRSWAGNLLRLLKNKKISERLNNEHRRKKLPVIMPNVLSKLIEFAQTTHNLTNARKYTSDERNKIVLSSDTPCQSTLFGLLTIKNSAVHAFSDPYTLDFLINRNSHSNQTEKQYYLNLENEEYLNACGRITREVMFDLIHNVFDLDLGGLDKAEKKSAVAKFNSEFMAVSESITATANETLCRLKVITGQTQGHINEVGVLTLDQDERIQGGEPIYVLDSPITAWRMYNYLYEFRKNYKKLLANNPEHFYKTVLPTVEWMEAILLKLSKNNQSEGEKMLQNMIENNVEVSVFHSL